MASVMGVKGPIADSALGLTLPHEHLFVDLSCYCPAEPPKGEGRAFYRSAVSLTNRTEVVERPWEIVDNARLDDRESAFDEARMFAAQGGKTIADLSCCSAMGRNPAGLQMTAERSGVNVIMSSGRYTLPSLTELEKGASVDDLERRILDEFVHGVNGVYPGLLKAGFVSKIDAEPEVRTLRAVGRVQRRVGCAVAVHPYIWEAEGHRILDVLEAEGCDLRRVILCHQDYLGGCSAYLDSLAKRGAFIEFDTFGSGWINDPMWQQTDAQRIGFLKRQVELGNAEKLLISGDMCLKIMLAKWGGAGYAHIPQRVIPAMTEAGMNAALISQITVENPVRVFCH